MDKTTPMNLQNINVKLPNSDVTFVVTRRFKDASLSIEQRLLLSKQLDTLNEIRKFAISYLEKTFGIKHLKRDFPSTQIDKAALISKIVSLWVAKRLTGDEHAVKYDLKGNIKHYRWDKSIFITHSTSVQKNLVALVTNFDEYRKSLKQSILHGSLQDRKKYFYNQKGTNPKHYKAVHAGSLSYKVKLRSVIFPCTGSMKPYVRILSNHQILLPDYGIINVKENLHKILDSDVRSIMLVVQSNNRIDVHVVIQKHRCRKRHNLRLNGLDWNLTNHDPYTDIYNNSISMKQNIVDQSIKLAKKYDEAHSKLSEAANHSGQTSNKYYHQLHLLNKISHKLSYTLDNHYYHLTKQLAMNNDYLAVESLDYNQMIQERASKNQNRANRRFMIIKPRRLHTLLLQECNRYGTTLVDVDCYKTSQMIFGTNYHCEKHSTKDRSWWSDYLHTTIYRDQNSACNILYWALNPNKHIKVYERKKENQRRKKLNKKLLPKITGKLVATVLN